MKHDLEGRLLYKLNLLPNKADWLIEIHASYPIFKAYVSERVLVAQAIGYNKAREDYVNLADLRVLSLGCMYILASKSMNGHD